MDRVASLITRASNLRRSIYSSLPFEERLAALFVKLALDSVETFGRAIGAEMLLQGVTDMPDPGPTWNPKRGAVSLPRGYMHDFAAKVYGKLMVKLRNPALVDEALQDVLLEMTTKHLVKSVSRSKAESFIFLGAVKAAIALIRRMKTKSRDYRQERSLYDSPRGEDEQQLVDVIDDPSALLDFRRDLSDATWRQWMSYLAHHIHPDIPTFIALSMQGYNNGEIIGHPKKNLPGMLPTYKAPPSGPNSFLARFVDQIPEVSKQFFESIGEELPVPA